MNEQTNEERTLHFGETPWQNLSREELLRDSEPHELLEPTNLNALLPKAHDPSQPVMRQLIVEHNNPDDGVRRTWTEAYYADGRVVKSEVETYRSSGEGVDAV